MSVGVGIIGARRRPGGYGIGHFIAREVLNCANSELKAIMGTTLETASEAADSLNKRPDINRKFSGEIYSIEQKDEFFKSPQVDLIIIASSAGTHQEYIEKALFAGKHVLSEKPLLFFSQISFKEKIKKARALIQLADKNDLLLATNCQRVTAVSVLCKEFAFSESPSVIDFKFSIGSKSDKLEDLDHLFELEIAHPLSLLVKYGITDFKAIDITGCSKESNSTGVSLVISGEYSSDKRSLKYTIRLEQLLDLPFAMTRISADGGNPVEITSEKSENGEIKSKFTREGKTIYSEDALKSSIISIINTLYYNDQAHMPFLSNSESFIIYVLQEIFREKISKDFNIF